MVALYVGNMNKLQVGVHSNSRSFETLPLERNRKKKNTRLLKVLGGTGHILKMSTRVSAFSIPS